jgi:hypothetical protein
VRRGQRATRDGRRCQPTSSTGGHEALIESERLPLARDDFCFAGRARTLVIEFDTPPPDDRGQSDQPVGACLLAPGEAEVRAPLLPTPAERRGSGEYGHRRMTAYVELVGVDERECEIHVRLVGGTGGWVAQATVDGGCDEFRAKSAQEAIELATQWVRFMADWWASGERPSRELTDY